MPEPGTFGFTRQQSPLGLGHAIWCARELVGNEPFALLLPDVLVQHSRGCLAQMIDAAKGLDDNANIIAVEEVPAERIHMYGVVGVGQPKGKAFAITKMVEKPKPAEAPSNLSITGRYILQPQIFNLLEKQAAGTGGEIQLTDAMVALARTQPFYGLKFEGRSFDCGSKIDFSPPTWPMGCSVPISRRNFAASCAVCSARSNISRSCPSGSRQWGKRLSSSPRPESRDKFELASGFRIGASRRRE